jgi:hypothetical protein
MHHTNTVRRSVGFSVYRWSEDGAAKLPDYLNLDFDKNTGVQRLLQMATGGAITPPGTDWAPLLRWVKNEFENGTSFGVSDNDARTTTTRFISAS